MAKDLQLRFECVVSRQCILVTLTEVETRCTRKMIIIYFSSGYLHKTHRIRFMRTWWRRFSAGTGGCMQHFVRAPLACELENSPNLLSELNAKLCSVATVKIAHAMELVAKRISDMCAAMQVFAATLARKWTSTANTLKSSVFRWQRGCVLARFTHRPFWRCERMAFWAQFRCSNVKLSEFHFLPLRCTCHN